MTTTEFGPPRGAAADLYRVVAVLIVVLGHWLVSAVTYRDGRFGNDYPLEVLPWTQWLTLVFQVVPVFFLVGGYASAASWERRPQWWQHWLRHRLAAILGPTAAYVVVALGLFVVLGIAGITGSALSFGGWAVAMHLWFIPVYLVVLSLTPIAIAADRRWGVWVPVALACAVVVVDVVARVVPSVGAVNYLLCWGAVYQLGICWRRGVFTGRSAIGMAVAGGVAVAALLVVRWYPISMVGAPGAGEQNNFPPTAALLAFAAAQSGLLIWLAPAIDRRLARGRVKHGVDLANSKVMGLYLWQMIPVVVVALAGYPTGLLPQAPTGSADWYLLRLLWVALLAVVAALLLSVVWALRRLLDRPLPGVVVPVPAWCAGGFLVIGVVLAAIALAQFAVDGFCPGGRLPATTVVIFVAGAALTCVESRRSR